MVSYRSVKGRLVGVWLIHVASSLTNICCVLLSAMAAVKISQSPAVKHHQQTAPLFIPGVVGLTLGVGVSGVQRHAVLVIDRRIKVALHVVYPFRYEVQAQLAVGEKVVKKPYGSCQMVILGRKGQRPN